MSTPSSPMRLSQEVSFGSPILRFSSRKKSQRESCNPLDLERLLAERQKRLNIMQQLEDIKDDNNQLSQNSFSGQEWCLDSSQELPAESGLVSQLSLIDLFEPGLVFHIFNKESINMSWLKPECSVADVPIMDTQRLVFYLKTEVRGLCLRRSTSGTACRYLLYLMSVHQDWTIGQVCQEILYEQEAFVIHLADLFAILSNYGTVSAKLWPPDKRLCKLPSQFKKSDFDRQAKSAMKPSKFPLRNLKLVLQVLLRNMEKYPNYSEEEKECLFYMLLNLVMCKQVGHDWNAILVVKGILTAILASYNEEEWTDMDCKMVEDLTLMCWNHDLESCGIVQRIELIPATTPRGIQLQRAAAFFAIQNVLDLNPINLCGTVTLDEILEMFDSKKFCDYPSDMKLTYNAVVLLSMCVDVDDLDQMDMEKTKLLQMLLNEWRHSIRDCSTDLDKNRFLVKDLMIQLCTVWNDSVHADTVV